MKRTFLKLTHLDRFLLRSLRTMQALALLHKSAPAY